VKDIDALIELLTCVYQHHLIKTGSDLYRLED